MILPSRKSRLFNRTDDRYCFHQKCPSGTDWKSMTVLQRWNWELKLPAFTLEVCTCLDKKELPEVLISSYKKTFHHFFIMAFSVVLIFLPLSPKLWRILLSIQIRDGSIIEAHNNIWAFPLPLRIWCRRESSFRRNESWYFWTLVKWVSTWKWSFKVSSF